MAVIETFSKRLKREQSAGKTDVYKYDSIPKSLRVQMVQILNDAAGDWVRGLHEYTPNQIWDTIERVMCREFGVHALFQNSADDNQISCTSFIEGCSDIQCLDMIDMSFQVIGHFDSKEAHQHHESWDRKEGFARSVKELNHRFKEHLLGYALENNRLIRLDSQLLHADVTKPAITLLNEAGFEGPLDEFMSAHQHFCKKAYKESMTDALKAFESTLKTIFTIRQWTFDPKSPAKGLLDVMFANKLIPDFLTQHFTSLRSLLESVPTARNRASGHGQGPEPITVPDYLASFALHITGSCIVLLIKAHNEKV